MKKTLIMVLLLIGLILVLGQASVQTAWTEEVVCGQWRRAYCSFSGANTPVFQPCGSSELWVPDAIGAWSLVQMDQFVRLYSPRVSYEQGFECEGQKTGYLWTARLSEPISSCSACLPARVNFWADSTSIIRGQCTTVHWQVDNVEAVYFNGLGTSGYGAQQVCPTASTNYNLAVVKNGQTTNYSVVVNVSEPVLPPTPVPPPTPTPRPAPTAVTEPVVRVRSSTVNLRSGPGTDYSVIGRAGPGTQLPITGKNSANDWWQVCCVSGQEAWVAAWVVDAFGPLGQVPIVTQPTPGPIPTPQKGKTPSGNLRAGDMAVITSNLRLRSDPGTRARVLTTMATGTRVRVLEGPRYVDGFAWWRVRLADSKDTSGWCVANWLSKVQFPELDLEPWCEKSSSAQLDSGLTKQACQYFRSEDDFDEFINLTLQSSVGATQCLIHAIETFELASQTGIWNPPPEMAKDCAEAYVDLVELMKKVMKDW